MERFRRVTFSGDTDLYRESADRKNGIAFIFHYDRHIFCCFMESNVGIHISETLRKQL